MQQFDLALALPAPAGLDEAVTIAASLFVPDTLPPGAIDLLVCLHGGTYSRFYWHAEIDGFPGYSFAARFAGAGRVVLTLDALGMGESSQPTREELLSPRIAAEAHHGALAAILAGIRAGDFGVGIADRAIRITGIGHSMGGMLTIVQQAGFASFDRVAILGWTNIGLAMSDETRAALDAGTVSSGYVAANRAEMQGYFHAADVPAAVIAADDARQSLTPASYGRAAIRPQVVAAEAAAIAVPVFLHYADIDVSPTPHGEPAFYTASRHITLTTLADAAHCHNFAGTRAQSWQLLDEWIGGTNDKGE
jgi:pimeloyl-ACP methyl ester carboxylesterase